MNVLHDADNVYVEVLAPGLNPESIQVSVLQGILQVSGDKQALSDLIKPEAFHRAERGGGRFSRSLTLPCEVDAAKVRAEYRSGILTVTLAKAEAAKPRRVVVKVQ
jgi:HSP20 family protein